MPLRLPRLPTFLVLLAFAGCAAAQVVHRCVDPEGRAIFSDRPCEHFGARERGEPEATAPATDDAGPLPDIGCAPSPEELRERLQRSIDRQDLNALAGLYHWPGAGSYGASATMRRLRGVMQRRTWTVLLDPSPDATPPHDALAAAPDPQPAWILLEHDPGGPLAGTVPATRFALVRHAGCWWIRD